MEKKKKEEREKEEERSRLEKGSSQNVETEV